MPAMLDDPTAPTIYRVSGAPSNNDGTLPQGLLPRSVTLRDRQSIATIIPFESNATVPISLLAYLADQLNREIDGGDTYPMMDRLSNEFFAKYWFQNFGAIMLLGNVDPATLGPDTERDWARECLGSFYIKPNYPGRSSHVCNAGFLVTDAARNRGVGRLMGEAYLDWAPRLGYTYSVFNLVYETNVASCRIWDGLGFKRIGRVKGCGNLKSYPDRLVDAIIYGRELSIPENPTGANDGDGAATGGFTTSTGNVVYKTIEADGELVSDERFDKIRFYLKTGRYPTGADRAEKSRLRSAATHYKLLPSSDGPDAGGDASAESGELGGREPRLMLRDREVISDPAAQMEIARAVHVRIHHGGINKTTSTVAEKYHWSRIKETVNEVIQTCQDCLQEAKRSAAGRGGNVGGVPAIGGGGKRVSRNIGNTTGLLKHGASSLSGGGKDGNGKDRGKDGNGRGATSDGAQTPLPPLVPRMTSPSSDMKRPALVAATTTTTTTKTTTTTAATIVQPLATTTMPATPITLMVPATIAPVTTAPSVLPPALGIHTPITTLTGSVPPLLSPGETLVNAAAAAAAAAAGSPVHPLPPSFNHGHGQSLPHPGRLPSPTQTTPSSRMPLALPSQLLMSDSTSPYSVIQPSISPLSTFAPTHPALSPSSPGPSPHHPQQPTSPFSPHRAQQHSFRPINMQLMSHDPRGDDGQQHLHSHQGESFGSFDTSPSNGVEFQSLMDTAMMVDDGGNNRNGNDGVHPPDDGDLEMLLNNTDDVDVSDMVDEDAALGPVQ